MFQSMIKNVRFFRKAIREQHKMSPKLLPLSIIHAILFESKVLVGVFLPSFMLQIASGVYPIEQSIILVVILTLTVPLLSLLQNVVSQCINNEQEKLFNMRVGKFDEKLHNLSLEISESNECLAFEEEALMGVYQTQNVVYQVFSILLGRIITLIVTAAIFANIHFMLVIFVLLTLCIGFIFDDKSSRMNLIYNREISKKQHARGYMNEIMFSIDLGAEERLYDVKDFSISQFGKIAKDIRVCEKKRSFSKLKYDLISIFLTVIQTIGIYLFAIWQFGAGTLKIYDFLIYTSAALMMSGAIKQIFNTYTVLSTMSSYYDATERYMTQPDCSSLDGNMTMPESITDIVFENVTFTYPNQTAPAIENLSFVLRGNDIVAIVGENGAGKSTIIKLLLRLYKIDSGRILLNGKSIYEYKWKDYCRFFASAFQDYNIYSLTVKENLLFGNSCSNIENHLKKIGLLDKINSLPYKLETPYTQEFSPDGILFSGGEEQKLIIARALCKETACVLTMDEPTASLDPLAERNLNRLTYDIRKKNFTLFVSHRFSTTRFCTKILVLDKGKLVECGTHDELMEAGGLYAEMYNMQVTYYR